MVSAVEIRLIATGAIDARAGVIRHDEFWNAVEVIESLEVAVDPVGQMLAQGGAREGIRAGPEHRDKERSLRHIAGSVVMNRDGWSSPIDEHLLAGFVVLPEDDILISAPSPIQFAETAVAVAVRMSLAILFPQQLQGDMFVGL